MLLTSRLLFLCVSLLFVLGTSAQAESFDPKSYENSKKTAVCPSTNRRDNVVKDIKINYVEVNPSAEKTILMVHGWPGLWSNWARQIVEFQDDYHIIAPDHRGFGSSEHPDDVESSGTMGDLVGDMVCVLENSGVEKAICLGHDWGAQVCWEAARMRPDIFEAVAAAVVPYINSEGPLVPITTLVNLLPRLAYQIYFATNTSVAVKELEKDVRRTMRATYKSADSPPPDKFLVATDNFLGAYENVDEIEQIPFMSKEEENYLIEQYGIQGFKNTLQFYTRTNRQLGWEFDQAQGNFTIPQPALALFPTEDPVADWEVAAKVLNSAKFVPNMVVKTMRAAHWIQLENPSEFNKALREWLEALPSEQSGDAEPEGVHPELAEPPVQAHLADEL